MQRYHVIANTLLYGDFYDSGDAYRYAKSLSKRLQDATVTVTREEGAYIALPDRLVNCIDFRNGLKLN